MSANHKRPLLAFVLVALACSMIIANGIRGQAVVSVVRAGTQHLVAGVELVVADGPRKSALTSDAEPELTPVGSVEVAAQQVFGGGHSVSRTPHRTSQRHQAKAHQAHARTRGKQQGHSAPGRGHGHDHGKSHTKTSGKTTGKDKVKMSGKGHDLHKSLAASASKGHAKGHGLAKSHGKGHAKRH